MRLIILDLCTFNCWKAGVESFQHKSPTFGKGSNLFCAYTALSHYKLEVFSFNPSSVNSQDPKIQKRG
eukprot:2362134-Amphidinium_carterae.1